MNLMIRVIVASIIMMLIFIPFAHGIEREVIIGKGHYIDEDGVRHKMGFFIIKEDGKIKRAFFKLDVNYKAINMDKWNESGGSIMNNAGNIATIILGNNEGEVHLHMKGKQKEYKIMYIIIHKKL